jgi:hypothetical protein
MPTNQNVDRVIKDFSSGTQQYAAGHLFFMEGTRVTIDHFVSALMQIFKGWMSHCFSA